MLVGVVGPSGVGKDSVMNALAKARPDIHLVRRVITRDAHAGGEEFESVDEATFDHLVQTGAFALHWHAHGLRYGIPMASLTPLAKGETCLVNLSRSVLSVAETQFPHFMTLHLTAPAEVLAQRLKGRGRETREEMIARLDRAGSALPDGLAHVETLSNDGPLNETVDAALAALDTVQLGRV